MSGSQPGQSAELELLIVGLQLYDVATGGQARTTQSLNKPGARLRNPA